MKTIVIGALIAVPLAAAQPALAAEPTLDQPAAQQRGLEEGEQLSLGEAPAPAAAEAAPREEAPRQEAPRKKHKSTGDKVLTGAAVILGIGALAVGGLLVAIFVG